MTYTDTLKNVQVPGGRYWEPGVEETWDEETWDQEELPETYEIIEDPELPFN